MPKLVKLAIETYNVMLVVSDISNETASSHFEPNRLTHPFPKGGSRHPGVSRFQDLLRATEMILLLVYSYVLVST